MFHSRSRNNPKQAVKIGAKAEVFPAVLIFFSEKIAWCHRIWYNRTVLKREHTGGTYGQSSSSQPAGSR